MGVWASVPLVFVAALGTWLALRYARGRLLDLPGERRSHSIPTPRGGGLGIAIALLAGCIAGIVAGVVPVALGAAFATGLLMVAGIGWIDDHRSLSPWSRLAIQCLAGVVLGAGMFASHAGWYWALLACAAVPVLVNVWNFMDGIDGIATTQAMIALACFALLGPSPVDTVAWGAFAACCGFLPFNYPRARIFLGDVGSGTIGYVLAAVGAWTASGLDAEGHRGSAALLVLPLSAFLVDASLTLGGRILRRERWWLPHVSHLYQRWAKRVGRHWIVTNAYALFSLLAGCVAYVASASGTVCSVAVVCTWLVLATGLWLLQGRRNQ
ncbi:MraY family glycosyltransferase [Pseudoxanthomonas suwonensis]|uniref:MraY family glycosyltransferase n=1 Tax=Pseudoxanthomonas suwonensis TaxID=314722 RepID=UPI00138EDAF4|nr:glycosyltransferase family 4 protein [Pseudoxanthomonas suwonensis]KAF1699743.1 glycosyl transferase [Pseudoxanthomonas suwonensis]